MLIQTHFVAKVVNSFEKEFEDKKNNSKFKYYNLGVMTEDGLSTLKCNKDVHEALASQLVQPMQTCEFVAVFDPDKRDFRVVALAAKK